MVFLSLFYMCKKNNQISIKRGLLSNIFWNQNVKVYNLVKIMYQKISIHFRTWITWISAKKKPKNEVCCCCFSCSWRRMFFQSNFELVFMALGHILPDLILGNCVQKCISWILPIISNEPFMTQDELRTWKIILRALQILPTIKSQAVDRSTIPFLSIFGVLPTEMCD